MIYIYDLTLDNNPDVIERYGIKYKFEKRFRMGKRLMATFVSRDGEKLIVIPEFAEAFRSVEARYKKWKQGKSFKEYLILIKKHVDKNPEIEDFPNDDSSTGIMNVVTCTYKNIRFRFEYMDNSITMPEEFEIIDNNIFGNGIYVELRKDEEE